MSERLPTMSIWIVPLAVMIGCGSPQPTNEGDGTGGAMNSSGGGGSDSATGGRSSGGTTGGGSGGSSSGGALQSGGTSSTGGADTAPDTGGASGEGTGGVFNGTCTASVATGRNASGSGPYDVVVETNDDPGIAEGTIYRPADLSGEEVFPIFVWGEGGCSQDGYSNASAMAEIASYGYFVVADGTPGGGGNRETNGDGGPLLAYIDWAIAENEKPCSAYFHSIDTTKVAANGFSCGGLMATGTAEDPRMTTWGHTSSGLFSANSAFYDAVHTPVLILTGTADDLAYENGVRDYEGIAEAGAVPVMLLAKDGAGHGGDLFQANGGQFTAVILAWLNWWLKDDETAAGKGALVGAGCKYCSDASWSIRSANLPQ